MCAAVLWQFGHNLLEVVLKVTVLLHDRKAVIIPNEVEDNGKLPVQKFRDSATPLKFKLCHVLVHVAEALLLS